MAAAQMADPSRGAGPGVVAAAEKENVLQQEEAEALREQVYRFVLSTDVLSSVKAHLRARLYAALKRSSGSATRAAQGQWYPLAAPARSPSLQQHVLNCLLAEYLLAHSYRYTLSVFLSESGSDALPRLCRDDILRLMGVLPESKIHALLANKSASGAANLRGCGSSPADNAGEDAHNGRQASLAEDMVDVLGSLGSHVSARSAECQTDAAGGGSSTAAISSQQLVQRLQQIEEEYQRKRSSLEQAAEQSLEERMAGYQRECDARYAKQLQEQLQSLRGAEVAAARGEEAARCRQQLEEERLALQKAVQERLARLNKQEEELLEHRRRAAQEQELSREEHLRRMRAEEDRMASRRRDSEAQLAAAQDAAKQAQQRAEAAEQQAKAKQQEAEQQLQRRLAEMQAREAEALMSQAAGQAELARVKEVQRQLAAALEEQGSLRQQLAASNSSHQAEQAALQLQIQALSKQKEQLQASAAATAAGLSQSDALRLQRAVRRLMQRVEELQQEVAGCRGRERLWRDCAAETEKLLDKSGKAHDRALQHGEDIRLALAAAIREVADLRQQAALAASTAEGPAGNALQAASKEAQHWVEGAAARVEAASRVEEQLRQEASNLRQRALTNRTAVAQSLQVLLAKAVEGAQAAHSEEEEEEEIGGGSRAQLSPAVQAMPAELGQPAPQPAAPLTGMNGRPFATEEHVDSHSRPAAPCGAPAAAAPPLQQPAPSQQPAAGPFFAPAAGLGALWGQPHVQPEQQPAASVPAGHSRPSARTASDILAAYRARQAQQGLGAGGGSSSSEPREVTPAREAGGSSSMRAMHGSSPQPGGAVAAGAVPTTADGDSYYVSDLTSDDSGRF